MCVCVRVYVCVDIIGYYGELANLCKLHVNNNMRMRLV